MREKGTGTEADCARDRGDKEKARYKGSESEGRKTDRQRKIARDRLEMKDKEENKLQDRENESDRENER